MARLLAGAWGSRFALRSTAWLRLRLGVEGLAGLTVGAVQLFLGSLDLVHVVATQRLARTLDG